jgi:uncharacterized protein (TIGR03435 family)
MENAHFNVSAKIPPGTTREDLRLMEQDLLVKRFKLAVHFDKKEMQIFELTVGKNGPKLKESPAPEKAVGVAPLTPLDFTKVQHDKDGFPVMPRRIGGMSMLMNPNGLIRIQANDETMEQFASMLTARLGKPVADLTGLEGIYDITLTCDPESMGLAPNKTGAADAASPTPDVEPAPTLMQALQQQLGLKLEQKKGPVDVLAIDHSEKSPIGN